MSPGRSLISLAFSTVVDDALFGDALGNIDGGLQTVDASVGSVGDHHDSTHAASYPLGSQEARVDISVVVGDDSALASEC